MRKALKTGWVVGTGNARVTLWWQQVDPNGDMPLDTPILRAFVNGVEYQHQDGARRWGDLGRTEKFGEDRKIETGPDLSGYEVFADLVATGKLTSQAANALVKYLPMLIAAMVDAAQVHPPDATELATVEGLADAVGAAARAKAAEDKADLLQKTLDDTIAETNRVAAAKVAAARAQARADTATLVEDRKAVQAERDALRNQLGAAQAALAAMRITP